jgi:hypothetical protein
MRKPVSLCDAARVVQKTSLLVQSDFTLPLPAAQ